MDGAIDPAGGHAHRLAESRISGTDSGIGK
jgi:hypothetical protein